MGEVMQLKTGSEGIGVAGRRFTKVNEIIERHGRTPSALIPILQEVQEEYRYLPEEILTYIAVAMGLNPANVYGVATFYSQFSLAPKGMASGSATAPPVTSGVLRRSKRPYGRSWVCRMSGRPPMT